MRWVLAQYKGMPVDTRKSEGGRPYHRAMRTLRLYLQAYISASPTSYPAAPPAPCCAAPSLGLAVALAALMFMFPSSYDTTSGLYFSAHFSFFFDVRFAVACASGMNSCRVGFCADAAPTVNILHC